MIDSAHPGLDEAGAEWFRPPALIDEGHQLGGLTLRSVAVDGGCGVTLCVGGWVGADEVS
jgi:hypothetical protein